MRPIDSYDDDRTFMEKYGVGIAVGVVGLLIAAIGLGFYFFHGKIPPPKKPDEIMVKLLPPPPLPPPPPPPPPPKIPPPPQQKLVELKPQDKTPPKPTPNNDKPAAPGPKASGPPSDDGIGGGNNGNGTGDGTEGGSVFGYYANQVGDQIRTALSHNSKVNKASFHVKLRVWFDSNGRVTRSKLSTSTGDPAVDSAITNEILASLQLPPPPQGMPTPIQMNLNATRPN